MESRRRFLQITCCAIVLAMCAGNVYATPVVSLDTEAEWAAAVGTQISPLSPVEWAALDPDFHANVGTGVFVESTVWASGGGLYVYEETTLDLEPGLVMQWGQGLAPEEETSYIGGWQYVYQEDPNLQGQTILMQVLAPRISPATGFQINTLGIGLVDANGRTRSWTYNCGLAAGNGMLLWNAANFIQIAVTPIGLGVAADALHGLNPPPGPFPWDLAAFADNGFDPTLTVSIVGIENGAIPLGGTMVAPPPGGAGNGPWNWWSVMHVTPEPATLSLVALGLVAIIRRRRR